MSADDLRWKQREAWRYLCRGRPLTATLLGPLIEEIIDAEHLVDRSGPLSRMGVVERAADSVEQAIALGREAAS